MIEKFRSTLTVACTLAAFAASPAVSDGPYVLERVTGGFVRLNTDTGEVSFCKEEAGQFACRISPSERLAYDNELAELHERLSMMEERLAKLETQMPAPWSSEEEIDRTLGMMERLFRGFMGIVKDLEKDFSEEPVLPEAVPEKTRY